MTMPEAVFFSSSRRLTITRSCNGRIFIMTPWIRAEHRTGRRRAPCAGAHSRLRRRRARGAVDEQHRRQLPGAGRSRASVVLSVLVLERFEQPVDAARAHRGGEGFAAG